MLHTPDGPFAIEEEARRARNPPEALLHALVDLVQDFWSAFRVWSAHLVTLETVLLCTCSLGAVSFFCKFYKDAGAPLAVNLNWTFFSAALVFPLSFSLNEAFRRRELALHQLAAIKANLLSIYSVHRDWDWPASGAMSGGRASLPPTHVNDVRQVLLDLNSAFALLLLKPNVGRARHLYTPGGRHKRELVNAQKGALLERIATGFGRLSLAVEVMKAAGMPGNEAARARQYSNQLSTSWEVVRTLKRIERPSPPPSLPDSSFFFIRWSSGPTMRSSRVVRLPPLSESHLTPAGSRGGRGCAAR